MNRRRYIATLAAGTASALAGCTSGGGGSEDTTTTATTTESTQTTTAAAMDAATVGVRSTDEYGDVLVDSDGMSLYLFTQDSGGESSCYGDCASNWPPLTVEEEPTAGDGVSASLGTTERDDGSMQVTADGNPLYYFANDGEPGDTNGQGAGDVWYLLAPDGSQVGGTATTTTSMDAPTVDVRSTDEYGDVLVDSDGMSLYLFTQDDGSTSSCYGDCADNWPPLTVEGEPTASDAVTAELGTTERDDGSTQVTAAGEPLYYFAGDSSPGDTSGQGVGDVWYLLAPDGSQIGGTSTTTTTTEGGGGGGAGGGY